MNSKTAVLSVVLLFAVFAIACAQSTGGGNVDEIPEAERLSKFTAADYKINLTDPQFAVTTEGGSLTRMNVETLPALAFQGLAFTLIVLEPCAINTPHIHPRASESLFVVNGTKILIGSLPENGVDLILNNLTAGEAMFVPRGAIHFEQNLECETVTIIAANNHEDPGVLSIANGFWMLPDGTLEASTGSPQDTLTGIRSGIPSSPGVGTEECRRRCGLI